ncbi:MAG: hypothetical protein IKU56_00965 [Clostridia bacterium]|nr:hypothetical protein [Clostridia bacterium]
MARERYLVGVSQEELAYTPPPPPPSTPQGKWENFWYHYKWVTIGVLFVLVAAVVVIAHEVTKVRPDYTVCVATQQELSLQATTRLQAAFEAVGNDRNGDGKVVVTVQSLNISSETGTTYSLANRQTLMAHIAARDVLLFALDPSYYHETLEPLMDDGTLFFAPIGVDAVGVSEDGTYWNWKESPLLNEADMQAIDIWQAVPTELYFGVRHIGGNEKEQREREDYAQLLKAFVAAHS